MMTAIPMMEGTMIYDRGYEIAIDIVPDIGEGALHSVIQRIWRKLDAGKTVSLTDIQEMLGIRGDKKNARYRLDPKNMNMYDVDVDSMLLYRDDPKEGRQVYGRRFYIWGMQTDRDKKRKQKNSVPFESCAVGTL